MIHNRISRIFYGTIDFIDENSELFGPLIFVLVVGGFCVFVLVASIRAKNTPDALEGVHPLVRQAMKTGEVYLPPKTVKPEETKPVEETPTKTEAKSEDPYDPAEISTWTPNGPLFLPWSSSTMSSDNDQIRVTCLHNESGKMMFVITNIKTEESFAFHSPEGFIKNGTPKETND